LQLDLGLMTACRAQLELGLPLDWYPPVCRGKRVI